MKGYKKNENYLFNVIKNIGETLTDRFHIIKTNDLIDLIEYKVYHIDGYCFDISKRSTNNKNTIWDYFFYSSYEGFKELSILSAINLFK